MSLFYYKFFAGFLIFITSLIAVSYPIKVRAHPSHNRFLELGDAFASGIFLGAALFHMLPDAISGFQTIYGNLNYPIAELFCAVGFLMLLFFERLSSIKNRHSSLPYVLTLILVLHSLIEGAVLGINSTIATVSVIFVAIIAHKGSESFALAVTLNRSHLTLKTILIIVGIFSVMTPLGIYLGATLTQALHFKTGQILSASFDAFAAGTFLYMSTLHHINHHHHENETEGFIEFICLLVGLGIMASVVLWV